MWLLSYGLRRLLQCLPSHLTPTWPPAESTEEKVGDVFLCFAGTARIASVTSILVWKPEHARQAPLNCWGCGLHLGSQQPAAS